MVREAMSSPGRILLGTSGWSYKSWDKNFYPPDVAKADQLEFYASQFNSVEINLTFCRLPAETMVQGWVRRAPEGFVFAVKGSRFITHMKKLANLGGATERYFERLAPLQSRVGMVLWQLPPNLGLDLPRLRSFLSGLPSNWNYAVEFRHASWIVPEAFQLLREFNVAHVHVSSLAMPMNLEVTSLNVYIRFHGLEGGAAHDYNREELEPWASHIATCFQQGRTIYTYFNNDWNVRAPANALLLESMVRQRVRDISARAEQSYA